eukprot:Em0007g1104a
MYGLSGVSGCYPCLYCLVFHENMVKPLSARGHAPPRTYESICTDHQRYIASGVRRKQVKHFYNCITEPIFNIPIEQVYGLLEDECHAFDLELALLSSEEAHSSFDTYSQELQMLRSLQSELKQAEEAYAVLQQMTTYVSLVIGEKDPVTADFFVQCEEKKKYLGKLEAEVAKSKAIVEKGFSKKEGPFVKALDDALQSIGVHRQQYFGGAFVGNHVHQALKECNIQKLCRSLCETAKNKLPHRSTQAEHRTEILVKAFSMFARCHNIYDHNFIDEIQAHALEEAVGEFMTFFRESFPQATVPIKMHLLDNHAVPWAKSFHVGFGLLGEQRAESIHAKFTRLSLSYTAITDKSTYYERFKLLVLSSFYTFYLLTNYRRKHQAHAPPSKGRFVSGVSIFVSESVGVTDLGQEVGKRGFSYDSCPYRGCGGFFLRHGNGRSSCHSSPSSAVTSKALSPTTTEIDSSDCERFVENLCSQSTLLNRADDLLIALRAPIHLSQPSCPVNQHTGGELDSDSTQHGQGEDHHTLINQLTLPVSYDPVVYERLRLDFTDKDFANNMTTNIHTNEINIATTPTPL